MDTADHVLGSGETVLETERLVLRRWRAHDLEPFAAMNADPEVMRHFTSGPLDRERSDALARRLDAGFDADGYGRAAVQAPDGRFAGFVGLGAHPRRLGMGEDRREVWDGQDVTVYALALGP